MKSTNQLAGQKALVTGASSGIGKEYARQLAAAKVDLILAARRLDRLEALAKELRSSYGVSVTCIQSDLSLPEAARILFEQASQVPGPPVTVLINNAGLGSYGDFMDFPVEVHRAVIQVNALAPTELTHYFVKSMLKTGLKSYVAQVASIAAFQPTGNFSVYSATKGYLRYFSETLAFELRNTPVHIFCVCPGGTYTEFFEHSGQKITTSGHRTMMSAEKVVEESLKAMLQGQYTYVPGALNKVACFLPRLLPRRLTLHLAHLAMSRAVEKLLP
jgi:short-subunit dehydrogenase